MPAPLSDSQVNYVTALDNIRQNSRAPLDIAKAANVSALAQAYPGISPGVLAALSQAGIGPGPQALAVWQKDLNVNANRQPGQVVQPKKTHPDDGGSWLDFVPVVGAVKGIVEGKSLGEIATRAIPGGKIAQAAEKSILPPVEHAISSGANTYLGGGAVNPIKDVTGTDPSSGLPNPKDVVRGAGVLANSPLEQVTGTLRASLNNPLQPEAASISQGFAQTQAAQTQQGYSSGTGFLPDPNSDALQRQAEAARAYSPYLVGGQAWTIGRAIAQPLGPGTAAYKVASGLIDASAAFVGDPVAQGLIGASALSKEEQLARGISDVTAAAAGPTAEAANETATRFNVNQANKMGPAQLADYGVISEPRQTVAPETFANNVVSKSGQRALDNLASETSPLALHTNYGLPYFIKQGAIDVPIAGPVAAATTPEEVANILLPHIGTDIPTMPTYRNAIDARILTPIPEPSLATGATEHRDFNQVAENADRALVNARATLPQRERIANTFANLPLDQYGNPDRPAMYSAVSALTDTFKEILVAHGVDETEATAVLQRDKDEISKDLLYGLDQHSQPLVNGMLRSGDDTFPVPHALYDTQFLNSDIALPNYREMRRLVSPFEMVTNTTGAKMATGAADAAMSALKKVWIMKAATGVRAVSDQQARMAAEGGASLFRPGEMLNALSYVIGNPDDRDLNAMELWSQHLLPSGKAQRELQLARAAVPSVSLEDLAADRLPAGYTEAKQKVTDLEEAAQNAGKLTSRLRRIKADIGAASLTPSGDSFTSYGRYKEALNGDGQTTPWDMVLQQNPRKYLDGFTGIATTSKYGPQAALEEIERVGEAKLNRAALDLSPQEVKDSFWSGDLAPVREHMAEDPTFAPLSTNRAAADAQIDLIYKNLERVHANNPKLIEAIRDGTIDGTPITDGWGQVSRDAIKKYQDMITSGEQVPTTVIGRKSYSVPATDAARALDWSKRAFSYFFDAILPRPSNYLAASPFDREATWSHAEDLFPQLSATDRASMIQHAQEANLGGPISNFARAAFGDGAGEFMAKFSGDNLLDRLRATHANLTADEAAGVAKDPTLTLPALTDKAIRLAGDDTQRVLFDLHTRSQFFDMFRLLFPFGPVFQDVATKWAKLAYQNPNIIRRAQQGIQALEAPGSDIVNTLSGNDAGGGHAFLFHNQFGDLTFAYPGSQLITQQLAGVPVPLTGSAQGLNLVGSGLPGFGPAVQIPLAAFLPNKPQLDGIGQILFPSGRPDQNPFVGVADTILPAWARRVKTALSSPESDKEYAGAVMDTASYLQSTGKYDLNGPNARAEMARLISDATDGARNVYLTRAVASFTLPSSPQAEWLAVDKSGNLTAQWRMSKWFYDQVGKVGYAKALTKYFDMFGTKNYLLLQPHTKANTAEGSTIQGLSNLMTIDGSKFERSHPDLVDKYPITYGLFAPSTGGYDNAAYQRQFENGQRTALTPKQMVSLANNRLAAYAYSHVTQSFPQPLTTDEAKSQQYQLSQLRGDLRTNFPGYAPGAGSSDPVNVFNELYRASEDPILRGTQAGRALNQYLNFRNEALTSQASAGLSSSAVSTAAAAAPIRAWLNERGADLLAKYPQFQPMWDSVLSAEVR